MASKCRFPWAGRVKTASKCRFPWAGRVKTVSEYGFGVVEGSKQTQVSESEAENAINPPFLLASPQARERGQALRRSSLPDKYTKYAVDKSNFIKVKFIFRRKASPSIDKSGG
jgi:hypothetical protein